MPRIQVLDGRKYLQCQYTYRYLDRAYGIPLVDDGGNFDRDPVTLKVKRWGSFADAAAAAAYVDLKCTQGKYTVARRDKYLDAIRRDMNLPAGEKVKLAPYIEPTRIGDALDYQRLCPMMMPDPDQCMTVEDYESKAKPPKRVPTFYLHEAKPDSVHSEPFAKAELDLKNYDRICLSTMGNKLTTILHRKPLEPELPNKAVSELTGKEALGEFLICSSQKAISSTPSAPSSTSSSQSSSKSSRSKRSSKQPKKSSKKRQSSSGPQTRSSKKRKSSALDSQSDSATPSKKSKKSLAGV
jgi:hypothetical protein